MKGAFLHAPINEDVFIQQPAGSDRRSQILNLKKSLYGLRQASKNWYNMLSTWIIKQGYSPSDANPCLYIGLDQASRLFIHVNDILVVGDVHRFKDQFLSKFPNSSAHKPNTLLGMKLERSRDCMRLSLPKHIQRGLKELGLENCRPSNSPCTPGLQLLPASS